MVKGYFAPVVDYLAARAVAVVHFKIWGPILEI